MYNTGLFINDLSMHDSSRDLVLAGTQQSAELKLALDQVRPIRTRHDGCIRLSFVGEAEEQSFGGKHAKVGHGNEEDGSPSLPNDSEEDCRSATERRKGSQSVRGEEHSAIYRRAQPFRSPIERLMIVVTTMQLDDCRRSFFLACRRSRVVPYSSAMWSDSRPSARCSRPWRSSPSSTKCTRNSTNA